MSADQDRFEAVYRDTYSAVVAFAVRRTGNPADAADVVAETYLTAWRRIGDLPPGDRARPWLFGVARLVLANHARGSGRRHRLADRLGQQLAVECRWHEDDAGDGRDSRVRAAFGRLDPADQELLSLVAWEGLSPSEIAVVIDCTAGAARVRLHRARRRFERLLVATERATTSASSDATTLKEPA